MIKATILKQRMVAFSYKWNQQIFLIVLSCRKNIHWTLLGKKISNFRWRFWCSRYLASRAGQVLRPRRSRGSPLVGSLPLESCRWTLLGKKKPPTFVGGLVFALPGFLGRPTYCRGVGTVRWTVAATIVFTIKYRKTSNFRWRFWCSRYLSSQAVTHQVLSAYMCLTSVFGMGTGGPT